MSASALVLRYAAFAVAAVAVNLASQALVFQLYQGRGDFVAAILVGTSGGLITKYLLDKNLIFFDSDAGLSAHRKKFTLYAFTGIFTTAIFWATEALFALTSENPMMKYLGALLGLSIGYYLKYHLDRRFVFLPSSTRNQSAF